MPRPTSIHVCSACGHETSRWAGQCPGCGEWNSLLEELRRPSGSRRAGRGAGGAQSGAQTAAVKPVALREVKAAPHRRLSTGIGELDTVLGGGIVPGSLVL